MSEYSIRNAKLSYICYAVFAFNCRISLGNIQKVRNGNGVEAYQHIPLRQARIASFFPTIKRDKGSRGGEV